MSALTIYQAQVLVDVRSTIALRPAFAWLRPSWVMASIQVESGFQPLVVNATGRQDGLMQVIPSTVRAMQTEYSLGPLLAQTDPSTSILCGICYLDFCARKLFRDVFPTGVPLSAIIEAYNEGEAAAEKGIMVPQYWWNWSNAWSVFSADSVDVTTALAVIPAPL